MGCDDVLLSFKIADTITGVHRFEDFFDFDEKMKDILHTVEKNQKIHGNALNENPETFLTDALIALTAKSFLHK